jgi:tetratricopeptide (TPR) repeat protein
MPTSIAGAKPRCYRTRLFMQRSRAACIIFAFLGAFAWGDNTTTTPQLLKAMGFAEVHNVPKALELCDAIIASGQTTDVLARAHWIKAVAYVEFMIEYRTGQYHEQFAREVEEVSKLDPRLLSEDLPYLGAGLGFYVGCGARDCNEDALRYVAETEQRVLGFALKQSDELLTSTIETLHPRDAYHLACAYVFVVQDACSSHTEIARSLDQRALSLLTYAARREPDNLEVSHMLWRSAISRDACATAEEITARLRQRFSPAPVYATLTWSPGTLMFQNAMQCTGTMAAGKVLKDWVEEHPDDVDAQVMYADFDADRTPALQEKVTIYAKLLHDLESLDDRGLPRAVRGLITARYRLAHAQYAAGDYTAALNAYNAIQEISPHYAQVHFNKGLVLGVISDKEPDPARRESLFQEALKELRQQMQYDYLGRAAEQARELEKHVTRSPSTPAKKN